LLVKYLSMSSFIAFSTSVRNTCTKEISVHEGRREGSSLIYRCHLIHVSGKRHWFLLSYYCYMDCDI
jgi:hypothetical protein